ncbi:DUF4097 family beta strand repeat-containing protein [Actinomadura sp. WMMB 499]|uniref:DUF4097 family beta strand repeat-containing protein n=1 Tax=Actinomadura sp. WMMB 499 TaxID=1219491 RepID=UPI00124534C8|nr:DUF4097 family beta strand repeat-containing protein [Actinomadura sp. WMMB 499]QFG24464.1 DUF4097 domain-containing protein [Actinomadura sp. WMMB 499]
MQTGSQGRREDVHEYTFETPGPIVAAVETTGGMVRLRAGDRADTLVDVRPSDPARDLDVQAAEHTRVEFEAGRLSVKTPRYKVRSLVGAPPSVEVTIDLPAGSRVDGKGGGHFRGEGRLGDTDLDTAAGFVRLQQTGRLKVRAAVGEISVNRAVGGVEVVSSTGKIWLGEIDGASSVKTSNGDITVGELAGEARLVTANGDIRVGRSRAELDAKTAHGSVRIGEAISGSATLETGFGEVEIGVPEGTAAWLEVSSEHGNVRSELDAADDPGGSVELVEIRARTRFADILVRRA